MTEAIWSDRIVPVVILPGGDRGDRVLDLIEAWTQSWLLTPAIWVRVNDVTDESGSPATHKQGKPPRVVGYVVGRNGRRAVDLFQELGRQEISTLRLLAVRWVENDEQRQGPTHDELQDRIVDILGAYLSRAQPERQRSNDGQEVGTDLIRINLIFAPSERTGGSFRHLLENSWEANVVVAPEDRPTPASFDAFTREVDRERMDSFLLAHIATAAGLWPGLNQSVYELPANNAVQLGMLEHATLTQRVFVRGVLSDGLVFRTAGRALADSVKGESPLLDPVIMSSLGTLELLSAFESQEAVRRMVDMTMRLDDGRLGYKRVAMRSVARSRQGFFEELRNFVKFSWDKLVAMPGWMVDSWSKKTSQKVTDALHGEDGVSEVDASIDLGESRSRLDRQLLSQLQRLETDKEALRVTFAEPLPLGLRESAPKLWTEMRKLVFSVLDGSSAPELIPVQSTAVPSNVDEQVLLASESLWRRFTRPFRVRSVPASQSTDSMLVEDRIGIHAKPITMVSEKGHPRVIGDVGLVCPDPRDVWRAPVELANNVRPLTRSQVQTDRLDSLEVENWVREASRRLSLVEQRLLNQQQSITRLNLAIGQQDERFEAIGSEAFSARVEYESVIEELEAAGLSPSDPQTISAAERANEIEDPLAPAEVPDATKASDEEIADDGPSGDEPTDSGPNAGAPKPSELGVPSKSEDSRLALDLSFHGPETPSPVISALGGKK